MGGIIINAIILYILVSLMGESSEPSLRWKVLGIAVALGLIETAISMTITNIVLNLALIVLASIAVAVALEVWCRLLRTTAIKIAAVFLGVRIALGVGLIFLLGTDATVDP
jgi:hypothetical protein